jgi:hypothetical protein
VNAPDLRKLVQRAGVTCSGVAAALGHYAIACTDDEIAAAADECIELVLQAALQTIDAAGVLPEEEERARLRQAISDYVDRPQPGRCRICGCTEDRACTSVTAVPGMLGLRNCAWADDTQTLCDNPACIAKAAPEAVA